MRIHLTTVAATMLLLLPTLSLARGEGLDGSCGARININEARPDCLGYNPFYASPGTSAPIGVRPTGSVDRRGRRAPGR